MTPQELIDGYASRGIRLYAAGGKVQIAGCRGALAPDDLEVIRQHRDALTAYLVGAGKGRKPRVKPQPVLPDLAGPMLERFGYQVELIPAEDTARRVVA